jgi:ankyrin repeat protein
MEIINKSNGKININDCIYYTDNPLILEELIKYGLDVNHIDEYGNTPLHNHIIEDGMDNLVMIKTLLKFGANPNIYNKDGETPLFSLIKYYCSILFNFKNHIREDFIEIVKLFLDYRSNPNLLIDNLGTFFTFYLEKNISKDFLKNLIKILIKYGLNINLTNKYNQNMGFFTNSTTLEILLELGLNPNHTDFHNNKIINHLIFNFFEDQDEIEDIKDQIKILDKYSIYNHQNSKGNTLMHDLCKLYLDKKEERGLFLYFYKKGASFKIKNNDGKKAIDIMDRFSLYYLLNETFIEFSSDPQKVYKNLIDDILSCIKYEELEYEFTKFDSSNNLLMKIREYMNK